MWPARTAGICLQARRAARDGGLAGPEDLHVACRDLL